MSVSLTWCSLTLQVKDTSDKTLLQKVADDIGLAKVAAGWREGIRLVYFKNLSPFVHGALPPTALQLNALTSARWTDSMAACSLCMMPLIRCAMQVKGQGLGQMTAQMAVRQTVTALMSTPQWLRTRRRRRQRLTPTHRRRQRLTPMHWSCKVMLERRTGVKRSALL